MKIRNPGEIWLADLGLAAKPRPGLVVSRADPDPPRVLYIYVPLITQDRGSDYEVELVRGDGSVLYITADMYLCRIKTTTKGSNLPGKRR